MSSDRRVRWSDAARRDVEDIADFIAEDSQLDAQRVLDALEAQSRKLAFHAERGRRLPEVKKSAFREVVLRPWRIVYAIENDEVVIVAVVDSRRDMVDWLQRHVGRFE